MWDKGIKGVCLLDNIKELEPTKLASKHKEAKPILNKLSQLNPSFDIIAMMNKFQIQELPIAKYNHMNIEALNAYVASAGENFANFKPVDTLNDDGTVQNRTIYAIDDSGNEFVAQVQTNTYAEDGTYTQTVDNYAPDGNVISRNIWLFDATGKPALLEQQTNTYAEDGTYTQTVDKYTCIDFL